MPESTLQFRLEDRQVRQFEDEGYVIVDRLFTDAELQPVIDEISADLDKRCGRRWLRARFPGPTRNTTSNIGWPTSMQRTRPFPNPCGTIKSLCRASLA